MTYLLDTNACIRYINGRAPLLRLRLAQVPRSEIVISSVTKAELFYGSAKSQNPVLSRQKQDEFLSRFESLVFDDFVADTYGGIRSLLEKQGTPISHQDIQIAATALYHQLILVTHNTREFSRIPGLSLEDWEI
jgi:tRNA(fMet)-specific endonuclease VapC